MLQYVSSRCFVVTLIIIIIIIIIILLIFIHRVISEHLFVLLR